MNKPKSILFQLKFVDLLNNPFSNLYHEVRELGRVISANTSDAQGLGTWISRPPGTILIVHVRHPLTKKMMVIKSYIKVPDKKGKYTLKAPFYIQTAKLRAPAEGGGSYQRAPHKVVAGESLYTIAKQYNTTWQILFQLNKDKIKRESEIYPGQWLKIPPSNSSLTGKTNDKPHSLKNQTHYKVKKGETLSGISQRSGLSVEELQRMNGISKPETLQAGQTIKLRGDGSAQSHTTPKPSPTPRPTPKPSSKPSSSDKEEGFFDGAMDTVTDIAKGTVGAIGGAIASIGDGLGALGGKAKEGLEGITDAMGGGKNDKPAGQAPATSNSNSNSLSTSGSYTVKSDDTLSGIAQKHGVNINDLARANGLKLTDTIHPGQKLKIPKGGSSSSSTSNSSKSSKMDNPVNITRRPSNSSDGTPKDISTTTPYGRIVVTPKK